MMNLQAKKKCACKLTILLDFAIIIHIEREQSFYIFPWKGEIFYDYNLEKLDLHH